MLFQVNKRGEWIKSPLRSLHKTKIEVDKGVTKFYDGWNLNRWTEMIATQITS